MSDQYDEREADMRFPYKEKSLRQIRECASKRDCEQAQQLLDDAALCPIDDDTHFAYNSAYELYVVAVSDEVKRKTGCVAINFTGRECGHECGLEWRELKGGE